MCQFSRIDRACGHFENKEVTFGNKCKSVCDESKSNTKAMARAGNCGRCGKIARRMRQSRGQPNGLGVSSITNKLSGLQVSAQPAPHGEKLPPKPAAPGQKPPPQVAPKPSEPRPGQKPVLSSSSSGRAGQGAATTPSAAVRVSTGTSQTRQGNRGVPVAH